MTTEKKPDKAHGDVKRKLAAAITSIDVEKDPSRVSDLAKLTEVFIKLREVELKGNEGDFGEGL